MCILLYESVPATSSPHTSPAALWAQDESGGNGNGGAGGEEGPGEVAGFLFPQLIQRKPHLRQELLTFRDHLLAAASQEQVLKVGGVVVILYGGGLCWPCATELAVELPVGAGPQGGCSVLRGAGLVIQARLAVEQSERAGPQGG